MRGRPGARPARGAAACARASRSRAASSPVAASRRFCRPSSDCKLKPPSRAWRRPGERAAARGARRGPIPFSGPGRARAGDRMAQLRMIKGTAVAPGLALGPVHVVRAADAVPTWSIPEEEVEREIARLHEALDHAAEELRRRQRIVAQQTSEKDGEIFSVHRMLLQDPSTL